MATPAAVLQIFVDVNSGKAERNLHRVNSGLKTSEYQAKKSSKAFGAAAVGLKYLGIAAGVTAGILLYKSVKAGATFERQMSNLKSVAGATTKELGKFEQQALKLGESTQYTANQVAEAQVELAKGGLTLKQIYGGGVQAALSLAAAGQLELAQAAETTVNAMKLFGIPAREAGAVADILATAANKTTGDVSDFSEALKQSGASANIAGLNLNQTVTVLESLAEAGIKGSDAGTSLKTFFQHIGNPSKKAQKAMEELNLSLFDQEGHLKKLPAISRELQKAFGDLNEQEFLKNAGTIAGTDSLRTLYAVYAEGPKKIRALEQANKKQGTAQQIAAEKMNNLQGDWEQFTGALETGEIKLYKVLKGPLRDATQWATGIVQTLANTDYGAIWGEIEGFYNKLHNATKIEVGGVSFSLLPEIEELEDALGGLEATFSWLIQASKDTFEGIVQFIPAAITEIEHFVEKYETELIVAGAALAGFAAGLAITAAIGAVAAAIEALTVAFAALDLAMLANPVGLVAAAIGALAAASYLAYQKIQPFHEAVDEVWDALQPVIPIAKKVGEALIDIGNTKVGFLSVKESVLVLFAPIALIILHFEDLKSIAATAASALVTAWKATSGAVIAAGKWIQGAGEWVGRAASNVAGFVSSLLPVKVVILAAKVAFLALKVTLGPLLSMIAKMAGTFIPPLLKVLGALASLLTGVLGTAIRAAATNFKTVWVVAVRVASAILQVLLKYIGNVASVLADVVGIVSNLLRGKWGNAWKDAKQLVVDVWHTIIDLLKGGWTVIKTLFSAGTGAIKSILKTSWHGIKGIFGDVADFLGSIFSTAWDTIEGIFVGGANSVIGVLNKVIGAINAIPGIPDIGKIGLVGSHGVSNAKAGKDVNGKSLGRQRGGPVPALLADGGLAATVPGNSTGDRHVLALGGRPVAKVESGEGIFVGNRKMMAAAKAANDAVPRFQKGGQLPGFISGGDILGGIGKVAKTAAEYSPPGLAIKAGEKVFDTAKSVIGALPSGAGIPEPFAGVGPYVVGKVADWIKSLPSSIFGGGGSGGGTKGPKGVGTYKGVPMANWVIESLEYAASKGASPQPTSGYRSHAQNVAEGRNYFSEHEKTQYPGGAVDFGGFTSGLAAKMSVVNATRDFKYPLLAPIGFTDDGHASGTGHQLGGLVQMLAKGGFAGSGYTVKSIAASSQQMHTAAEIMEAGDKTGATQPPRVAAAMAATQESNMGSTGNTFQLIAPFEGVSPSDNAFKQAVQWFTKGYYDGPVLGSGGGIEKAKKSKNLGLVAQEVEGSAYPGLYAQWKPEGQKWAEGWNGHRTKAEEVAGTFKEDVPAEWHGVKAGQSIKFPSIPKTLDKILAEKRKTVGDLGRYRAAAKAASKQNKPAIAQAIEKNIHALETRRNELEHAAKSARLAAAQKKFKAHLGKVFGKLTGAAQSIEMTEDHFGEQQEIAEHIVALEPVLPEFPESMPMLARAFKEQQGNERLTSYINKQETPAYENLMSIAGTWRNQILRAEHMAAGDWAAKGPLGGVEGNWENQILKTAKEIEAIEALQPKAQASKKKAQEDLADFRDKHGKKADLPDWLTSELSAAKDLSKKAEKGTEQLPLLAFREKELRNFLGQGQEAFYPGGSRISDHPTPPNPGSGTFEGLLENLQGRRWPGLHEALGKLPVTQNARGFGGIIWGLQEQLKELGLKLPGAVELGASEFGGEGGAAGGEGGSFIGEGTAGNSFSFASIFGENWDDEQQSKAQRIQEAAQKSAEYWEEQTRLANQRNAVFTRQSPIIDAYMAKNFAGFHAKGGFIPVGKWGIAGEAGPEIVHGPATVVSNAESAAMGGGSLGGLHVSVTNHRDGSTDVEAALNGRQVDEVKKTINQNSRSKGRMSKTIGAGRAGRLS